jgi:hypothetical protein
MAVETPITEFTSGTLVAAPARLQMQAVCTCCPHRNLDVDLLDWQPAGAGEQLLQAVSQDEGMVQLLLHPTLQEASHLFMPTAAHIQG